MTTYRISNINGKFGHVIGKAAAVARIREIEGDDTLSAAEIVREFGWTIKRCTAAEARAAGISA
jgi:hypothetical protein